MIKLGENIRKLRLKSELTQEQLADVLDISPQSVSRWENNAAYPDITMLPALANYFGVTADELLGIGSMGGQEETDRIIENNNKLLNKGLTDESIAYLRDKLSEFPHSPAINYQLAHSLWMYSCAKRTKEPLNEIMTLCNKAMRLDGGKTSLTLICENLLCSCFKSLGMKERAEEMAVNMPSVWGSREIKLAQILDGKEEFTQRQYNTLTFLNIMIHNLHHMARFLEAPALRIELLHKAISIADILTGDDHKFYNEDVYVCYLWIARNYCTMGDREKAFENLELALKYAKMYERRPERSGYDVFWLPDVIDSKTSVTKNDRDNLYEQLLKKIAEEPFELLHGSSEYEQFRQHVIAEAENPAE